MADLPHGWLTGNEANLLCRCGSGKTVLEMGSWRGRSTVQLAQVATHLISVDRHQGIAGVDETDSLPYLLEAVRHLPNVTIMVGLFENVIPLLKHVDMVFIDGDHDVASVARDIRLALPLEPDLFTFHDYDFNEVREAIKVALGRDQPDELADSLAVFR